MLINAVKQLSQQNKELAREVSVLNAQSKQISDIAKLMCADHPGSKACDDVRQMASISQAAK